MEVAVGLQVVPVVVVVVVPWYLIVVGKLFCRRTNLEMKNRRERRRTVTGIVTESTEVQSGPYVTVLRCLYGRTYGFFGMK